MKKQIVSSIILGVLALLGLRLANAQQPQEEPQGQVDNDAGVARVSFIRGDVSMQRGDSGDFSEVTLNTPLVAGDKISTGDNGRTELELDHANVLRLDSGADAHITALTRSRIGIQIGEGLANYSVMDGAEADVDVEAPNVTVHPLRAGEYRIQVLGDEDAEITVRSGEAEVSTDDGSTHVGNGQAITVHGIGRDAEYKIADAPSNDDWDRWNQDRDGVILNARSWQDTNRYYTGAHDLDAYGGWTEVPDYGRVWVPRVQAGWAPYRAGRWVYEPYYGWTWVSAEPWGWAPYHYGRWFVYNNSWCWWPGPVYGAYRPIWAPAYVSFFGFGRGSSLSIGASFGGGFGSIGWLPIGPGDYFHPWWGGYRQRYNVVDIRNVYNIHDGIGPLHRSDRFSNMRTVFNNDRVRDGVSGVPAGSFGRGFVHATPINASEFRGGRAIAGNLPVTPSRESMRFSDRPVGSWAESRVNRQERFFSTSHVAGVRSIRTAGTPATARPQGLGSGDDRRSAPSQNGGWERFGGGRSTPPQEGYRSAGGGQRSVRSDQLAQAQSSRSGWWRFSDRGGSRANDRSNDRPNDRANDRGTGRTGDNYRSPFRSDRPPLDISKPIISERNGSNANRGYNRGEASSGRDYRGGGYGAIDGRGSSGEGAPVDRGRPITQGTPDRASPVYRQIPSGAERGSQGYGQTPPYRSSGGDPPQSTYRGGGGRGYQPYPGAGDYRGGGRSAQGMPSYRSSGGDPPQPGYRGGGAGNAGEGGYRGSSGGGAYRGAPSGGGERGGGGGSNARGGRGGDSGRGGDHGGRH